MRELMINEIKGYYWFHNKASSEADYVAWLNSLSDEKLLSEYNTSSKAINDMD